MKIVDIRETLRVGVDDEWFTMVMLGPFKSKEDADEFAALVGLLESHPLRLNSGQAEPVEGPEEAPFDKAQDAPPALGINVVETITTKDKFG